MLPILQVMLTGKLITYQVILQTGCFVHLVMLQFVQEESKLLEQ